MLTELGKRIDEQCDNFTKELVNIILPKTSGSYHRTTQPYSTIPEMENTLEGIKNRLGNTEERISDLKDRITEITQSEQQKENKL